MKRTNLIAILIAAIAFALGIIFVFSSQKLANFYFTQISSSND